MAEESNVWESVRDLLERTEERMNAAFPAEGISVTPPDAIALGMYSRCMSLFRSIVLLLSNNQPEEAVMLWRSLFTDSLRLMELAAVGKKDRIAIELGHYAHSLERTKQRFQRAKELGVSDDITSELAQIESQKRAMENYRKSSGIEKLKRFSSEENLINRLNLRVDLWSFLYSHAFVHGEDIAHTLRRRRMQAGVLAFFSHNVDPGLLAAVGLTALQSAIDAHEAARQLFGWEVSTELQTLIEDLEDLHRRLNERRSQNADSTNF